MKRIAAVILVIFISAGCASISTTGTEYALNTDYEKLYSSVLKSFFDMNYMIEESDMQAGVVTGKAYGEAGFFRQAPVMTVLITKKQKSYELQITELGGNGSVEKVMKWIKNTYDELAGNEAMEVVFVKNDKNKKTDPKNVNTAVKNEVAAENTGDKVSEKQFEKEGYGKLNAEIGGYVLNSDMSIKNMDRDYWKQVEIICIYNYRGGIKKYYKDFKSIRMRKPVNLKISEMRDEKGNSAPKDQGKPDKIIIKALLKGKPAYYVWEKN